MDSIKNLYNISPESSRVNKNNQVNKLREEESKTSEKGKTSPKNPSVDSAEISSAGREMLNLRVEANKFMQDVRNSETLDTESLEAIKLKIENKYYLSEEVVDQIVNKLLDLPNYLGG